MIQKRVKVSSIVDNQLPQFVKSEFPLVQEFLSQYYRSLESNGNPYDLMNNIDQYVKVDNISNLIKETVLTQDVNLFDTVIFVNSTAGFPENFGLIQLNDEIIVYESKTQNSFENCYRGFSGVTSYNSNTLSDELIFSTSTSSDHDSGDIVKNLNSLLLSEFFNKIKTQITPGFENREFYSDLNERLFVKESNSFYTSKGTSESFRILFGSLYGKPVKVILPRDFLLEPSDAQYRISKDIVVEIIDGDPLKLVNKTLYQDESSARGTITGVEKITKFNNTLISKITEDISPKSSKSIVKDYYILSLDYDYDKNIEVRGSTSGEFKIHPKTKLVSTAVSGQSYLDVDSTAGFENSGSLLVDFENGSSSIITYKSKSLTQFFDCSGIDRDINAGEEIKSNSYAYAIDGDSEIRVRITGVISEVNVKDSHNLISPGNSINLKSLGKSDENNYKLNNWIFNVASRYSIEKISQINSEEYSILTYDDNDLKIGDKVTFTPSNKFYSIEQIEPVDAEIVAKNDREILVICEKLLKLNNVSYDIVRKISKLSILNHPELSIYNANVSNVYYDNSDDSVYVTCPSLPNYGNENIKINDFSLNISSINKDENIFSIIKFNQPHSFLTGDNIIVKLNSGEQQIVGFAKKISSTEIKLAKNKDSIISDNYFDFSQYFPFENGLVQFLKFNSIDFGPGLFVDKTISPQKLIRKISNPIPKGKNQFFTESGPVGIFVNGVEIQNYKSEDYFYYGDIKSIDILSKGTGYDVINPPELIISDKVGYGASAYCSVIGSLERIDVIDSGFNYLEVPKIEISGGNGIGAEAEASLITYEHVVKVFANPFTIKNNEITFENPHNFFDSEEIIYNPQNSPVISGLSTNSTYFVKVVGINTIKLCHTLEKFNSSSFVSISVSENSGIHQFKSTNKKRKLGDIKIVNSGSGYINKKQIAYSSGISTSNSTIKIKNHGFKTGEIIYYVPDGQPIGGLTTSNYYVNSIDEDTFRLYQISDEFNLDFLLKSDQYVVFSNIGGEKHYFNYPEIKVSIKGKYQIPALRRDSSDLRGIVKPIFRGELNSIFLVDGGNKYGTDEIVNYNKQPQFIFNSGNGAKVELVIINGEIKSAYVSNSGDGYNSSPTLVVNGDGSGAKLVPVVSSGKLSEVRVISSGKGYTSTKTSVSVISAGQEAKCFANIKSWNVCLPQRFPSLVNSLSAENTDDGYLVPSKYGFGIQYTHLYSSRQLRRILGDLLYIDGFEENSSKHSPILGWAYDGNPIYGPYGFSNPDSTGGVRLMRSGYSLSLDENRPNNYPNGFFVEDYVFTETGDLDEFNGRFCITPEYPNGIYAYFTTFGDIIKGGYRVPEFPYVIGNSYKSTPIEFNFSSNSTQDFVDLTNTNWLRNTYPYNVGKEKSSYDYFLNSSDLNIKSTVTSVNSGGVENVKILYGGEKYKVNDKIIFDNTDTGGLNASALIEEISGVGISTIEVKESLYINNVELKLIKNNNYVGYSTIPHNIANSTKINIFSPNETPQYVSVNVSDNILTLTSGISSITSTGICTFISVSGNLDILRENDFYQIDRELVKIISIDKKLSRIKILRSQNIFSGNDFYESGTKIIEKPRRFNLNYVANNQYNSKVNKEIYFDPSESVGLGTSFGVGVTTTLYFSNAGSGQTSITIPTKAIYLPNHDLETGDRIFYSANGGDSIIVSEDSGITTSSLQNNLDLFVTKISKDLIGISTVKIGIDSGGNYSGIGTISADILYFIENGSGNYHSFKTIYPDVLTVEASKNTILVSTKENHGLSLLDNVNINVESKEEREIIIRYNDYNRRIIVDPLEISSVNIVNDSLVIPNNNLKYGEKVIFEEINEITGLSDNSIYYVSPINSSEFRLSTNRYNLDNKVYVGISSSGNGYISKINPEIQIVKYQTIKFNLSDESLSYTTGGFGRLPSFRFELFYDEKNSDRLYPTNNSNNSYTLVENGTIGISGDASATFKLNEDRKIYYKLTPIDTNNNLQVKKEIIIDKEQINYSQINLSESFYNGKYSVTNISNDTFSYEVEKYPENNYYTITNSNLSYTTTSKTSLGAISKIKIKNSGNGYRSLPQVNVISNTGTGSILRPESSSIGIINKVNLPTIGYNYSPDLSIRPIVKIPTVVSLDTFSIFDSIDVIDKGFSYQIDTNLVVVDGLTKQVVNDTKLEYSPNDVQVRIIKNTNGISSVEPTIIPIGNSNGIGISSIFYDDNSKNVTLFLDSTFSDIEDFPFEIGSRILVEGCNIRTIDQSSNEFNYNSSEFNYALFELIDVDSSLGFYGANITYNMSEYLNSGKTMGTFSPEQSSATVVPEIYFPKFRVSLKKNNFIIGESILTSKSSAIVENWNPKSEIMVLSTKDDFYVDDIIFGKSSNCLARIISVKDSIGSYEIKSNSIVNKLWNSEKGFLNNDNQRLHDNDYYQYFSYVLKSEVPISTWNDSVSSLNHAAGFKKFSIVEVENYSLDSKITQNQNNGNIDTILNLDNVVDLDCVFNFDLAQEDVLNFDNIRSSNKLYLNSKKIQDYVLSIGNKVLILDDISDQFNNEIRADSFSIIDTFAFSNTRYVKYFIRCFDRRFSDESMFSIMSVLHDNRNTYTAQYGKLYSKEDLGFFDSDSGRIIFYPNKTLYNDYSLCFSSISITDTLSGISTISLGDCVSIQSYSSTIPENTIISTPIVSISSTFRSAKIHTVISDNINKEYSFSELNIVHDGSNVYLTEYANLSSTIDTSYSGLGTFGSYISGSDIIVSFTPNVSTASTYDVNSIIIGIGDTSTSGIGTENLTNVYLESNISSINSTPTPSPVAISTYLGSDYATSYNIISIEDLTNNQYQLSEIITDYNADLDNLGQTEYGVVSTGENLGIITSGTEGSGLNTKVVLYFTPEQNTKYEIKIFKLVIGNPTVFTEIDLDKLKIKENIGVYFGRFNDVSKNFELTYNQNPVFEKKIDASNPEFIDTENDVIMIPNHYFTTGEKIKYNLGGRFGSPIGIGTTSISGIGLTDKLPPTLYAIKIDDLKIRVSASASEALLPIPKYLDLTSPGISEEHTFASEKQNSKCLISIDNVVQSPVVSTSKTTFLLSDFTKLTNVITVDDPFELSGGDYLQIDDEIVKTVIVGYAGTFNKILVDRQYLGTLIDNHSSGTIVKKIEANYNIIGNTIYFADAPKGKVPEENPLDPEQVDFEGLKIKSSFSGRVFLRSGITNTDITPYENNYVFDSISNQFDNNSESFAITSDFQNVSGISSNNFITLVRNIFQLPERNSSRPVEGDYSLSENSGITSITFKPNSNTADYDVNLKNIPRGGIIISVGSLEGFGYQPLVAAGGTAIVSSSGTISSVSIGNSGSGYRSGIQTNINVGIKTLTNEVYYIGTAESLDGHIVSVAITNPGIGYTSYYDVLSTNTNEIISIGSTLLYLETTNNIEIGNLITLNGYLNRVKVVSVASTFVSIGIGDTISTEINSEVEVLVEKFSPPILVFDNPLSYSNIPLVYSSSTPRPGFGTEATVDLIVSQDSSILSFEIRNYGYGYNKDDILTVDVGGPLGIPTNSSLPFEEFRLTVDGIYDDQFASWHLGKLIVIDPIDDLIDGRRKFFPIRIDGKQISFEAKSGSNFDLSGNLIIFINDILQVPGESYVFNGGSVIEFIEPPISLDDPESNIRNVTKTKILFYEGTEGIDTLNVDIFETIKIGDSVRLDSDDIKYKQNRRIVNEIVSSDSVRTNLYSGKGVTDNDELLRNIIWCKQRDDIFLSNVGFGVSTNNYIISKARESYEPYINPSAYLIKDIEINDSEIFVDNLQTFFNSFDEIGDSEDKKFAVLRISSQDEISSCIATPLVLSNGSIDSILIDNGGFGYESAPKVYISPPNGIGITCTASAFITGSTVSNITVTNNGEGYSQESPPSVLIEPPISKTEIVQDAIYEGDFGIITGIETVSTGLAVTGIVFDLFIPENSYIRNNEISGTATTSISGIDTGYYFVINNSNVGNGLVSLNESGDIIGVGVSFIDNVYMVSSVSIAETTVVGVGTTYVSQVTVSVSDYNGLVSLGKTNYYGSYSWGRISGLTRFTPKQFTTYKNGIAGIVSSPIIQRYQPLKNNLYTS